MLDLRRSAAAALLVGAAMIPALAATPAYAVGYSSAVVVAAAADWTYVATYNDFASCDAAGWASGYAHHCVASSFVPGGYDLYLWL
ncbi:hypothetical protein [Modestobacter marinus]|uniref:hypothetical protein n=1 Tax=Modestobacter marinus TaxID=477641 RepID=UPI001C943D9C|nr:hypothetical protein [Modestobacter marinus]